MVTTTAFQHAVPQRKDFPMTRTVMLFGDSNTHGTPPMPDFASSGRFPRSARWTTHFAASLPEWDVIAEGQPGRTTVHDDPIEGPHRNGLTVLPALLDSHQPLDVVLIILGTNDLKARFSVTPTDIAVSLERLVTCIRQSGAGQDDTAPQVMIVCPPPIIEVGDLGGIFAGGAAKSHALAAEVARMAQRIGVPFVDAAPLIAVSPIDGIHYDEPALPAFGLALAGAMRHHFA
jgi:lysophospholipase L1-like esterase